MLPKRCGTHHAPAAPGHPPDAPKPRARPLAVAHALACNLTKKGWPGGTPSGTSATMEPAGVYFGAKWRSGRGGQGRDCFDCEMRRA